MDYRFKSIQGERILLAYLNWGNGHLARCIDVCKHLMQQNNELIIAAPASDHAILLSYIPSLTLIEFDGYPFEFKGTGNFATDLWSNRKKLAAFMFTEHDRVEKLVTQHQIGLVLSDHRYGFRSAKVPSIFITHQVQLALNWWQFPAQMIHKGYMNLFNHVWIMDNEAQPLAGKLSKNTLKNASYIGRFSRFEARDERIKDLELGVVNGPHPYNEQLLKKFIEDPNIKIIISPIEHYDRRVVHTKNWQEADAYFYRAKTIYAYAGYSTIMDLERLKTTGVLFATPGQTEQIYLEKTIKSFDFRK